MANLSEHEIEFIVEKTMDKLDRELMSGKISHSDYDAECQRLDDWADNQYRLAA